MMREDDKDRGWREQLVIRLESDDDRGRCQWMMNEDDTSECTCTGNKVNTIVDNDDCWSEKKMTRTEVTEHDLGCGWREMVLMGTVDDEARVWWQQLIMRIVNDMKRKKFALDHVDWGWWQQLMVITIDDLGSGRWGHRIMKTETIVFHYYHLTVSVITISMCIVSTNMTETKAR